MGEWVLRGASASPGLATGRARVLTTPSVTPARPPAAADPREAAADPGRRPSRTLADEAYAARVALEQAASELEEIAARLQAQGRAEEAEIVETGALMARDPVLEGTVSAAVVERGLDAATALVDATDEHAAVIAALPDPLLASRSDDVRSLGRRAARIAAGEPLAAPDDSANFILVADDVGPADVAEHCDRLEGIALAAGAVTAHAAIVARSLGIPMTVQAGDELLEVTDGTFLVVDGTDGEVIANPSPARTSEAAAASESRAHARAREQAEAQLPSVTADGRRVRVLVNAATPAEIAAGLAAGAEGAGLIRTELAFLDVPRWPSKADHLRMLAPLLRGLGGRTATVRVLDFGGDKVPPFLAGEPRRGIELLLAHPGALRAQLAAIAQLAGGEAEVRVLLPLVRGATDVSVTRAILETIGHDGDKLGVGAMIELPVAAVAAHEIAAVCNFLSIGTNDLTHATLGTDRFTHNEAPAHDPRVLGHIARSVEAANAAGIPIEVCGEAASDPLTVPLLVGLGADELSVGAARVGSVRAWIRALDGSAAATSARSALEAADAAAVERLASPLHTVG